MGTKKHEKTTFWTIVSEVTWPFLVSSFRSSTEYSRHRDNSKLSFFSSFSRFRFLHTDTYKHNHPLTHTHAIDETHTLSHTHSSTHAHTCASVRFKCALQRATAVRACFP